MNVFDKDNVTLPCNDLVYVLYAVLMGFIYKFNMEADNYGSADTVITLWLVDRLVTGWDISWRSW